jgi:drug/metabolite transporter (DMT)-like permease
MGCLLARRKMAYRVIDLVGIGAIAMVLIVAGVALMAWSGFSLRLFDVQIGGVTWALLGALSAVVVVRAKDAILPPPWV